MSAADYQELRAELLRLEAAEESAATVRVAELQALLADYDRLQNEVQRLRGLVRAQTRTAAMSMSSKLKEALRE